MAKRTKVTETKEEQGSFIVPLIRVNNQPHVLEEKFEKYPDKMPVIKSIGYFQLEQGKSNSWISYTLTTQGDKVLGMEVSEPDQKMIAEENSKIAFVNLFADQGLM